MVSNFCSLMCFSHVHIRVEMKMAGEQNPREETLSVRTCGYAAALVPVPGEGKGQV